MDAELQIGFQAIGKDVLYDVDPTGTIATITLNRPDSLNAMGGRLIQAALAALTRAASDPNLCVVILTGAGKGFCAGGDVKGMAGSGGGKKREGPKPEVNVEGSVLALRFHMMSSELLRNMNKITIAAINGACAGAGFSWACACDIRYAVKTAKFTTAFVNVGLSGDFGGTWLLPRIVGAAKARALYLTADKFTADEALRIGLVEQVLPDTAALMEHVRGVAQKLTHRAPTALQRIKANLNDADRVSFTEGLNNEADRHGRMGWSPENRIAATAFVQKKTPDFSKLRKREPWELSRL